MKLIRIFEHEKNTLLSIALIFLLKKEASQYFLLKY
jgi:hypothetical protein